MIQKEVGIPPDRQLIVFNGEQLENEKTLFDCNLKRDDTINVVMLP